MTRVAFQGERGSFSEDAVMKFFAPADTLPCRYLPQVFEAILSDEADFGVIPVENSQAGSINESYDLLLKYELNIFGELDLRVSHCLLALPGDTLEGIKRVYSHPQALAQCEEFLKGLNVELVPIYDTAGSAKMIYVGKLKNCAAIASKGVSQLYHITILTQNIETNPNIYTKFFVISQQKPKYAPRNKTSLIFATNNIPGALYACLGVFATRGINLAKLESRPTKDKPWEYIFYVDFEGHIEDEVSRQAIEELGDKTTFLKLIGSYPSFVQ